MIDFTLNKNAYRCDDTSLPIVTATGLTNIGKIRFGLQNYLTIANSSGLTWNVANRTQTTDIFVKNVLRPTWVRDAGIDLTGGGDLIKSGATAYTGAYFVVNQANCGIEAKTASTSLTTAISLQTGAVTQDFFTSVDVEHCLVFGGGGLASVYEKGIAKKTFQYVSGDSGLIEKRGNIVRYFKVSSAGELTLIRSTRSTLSDSDIKACALLYTTGSSLENIYVWTGEELSKQFQVYAVLQDFQDFQNSGSVDSLGEKTVTKERQELITYFTDETSLRSVSINLAWRKLSEYKEFEKFWKWHDLKEPFIFVDTARSIEYFAKFVSSFKDNPIAGWNFGIQTDIRELIDPPSLVIF